MFFFYYYSWKFWLLFLLFCFCFLLTSSCNALLCCAGQLICHDNDRCGVGLCVKCCHCTPPDSRAPHRTTTTPFATALRPILKRDSAYFAVSRASSVPFDSLTTKIFFRFITFYSVPSVFLFFCRIHSFAEV